MSLFEPLLGVAALARRAFAGEDLSPVAARMLDRVERDPQDADALMDLSVVLQLLSKPHTARALQERALSVRTTYHLPAPRGRAELRLLVIMAPGDLMANTPLDFLLEDSGVAMDMIYVSKERPLPNGLPPHDVAFVAVADSDENLPVLRALEERIESLPQAVLNRPAAISRTTREATCAALDGAEGIVAPPQQRLGRAALESAAEGAPLRRPGEVVLGFPVIIRPASSHAGHGLARVDSPTAIRGYLSSRTEEEFYVAPFVDYRSSDGLYRKYRIVLVDGIPYASHMAISESWMVHYLSAGMTDSADKRREEERFMRCFDEDFRARHAGALDQINRRIGLDYLVIDCAETLSGELLVFEVDAGAVVHAMDPPDLFPYKQVQMQKVFSAFQEMLARRCGRLR